MSAFIKTLTLAFFLLHIKLSSALPLHPQIPLKNKNVVDSSRSVIIQMFEWTWDSIAAECTEFIGPAGYGYVQGKIVELLLETMLKLDCIHSKPCSRTRRRTAMVDGLSTSLLHAHVKTRQSRSIRQHGRNLPRSWCQSHCW